MSWTLITIFCCVFMVYIYIILALPPKQYMNRAIRLEKHCKKLVKYLT